MTKKRGYKPRLNAVMYITKTSAKQVKSNIILATQQQGVSIDFIGYIVCGGVRTAPHLAT